MVAPSVVWARVPSIFPRFLSTNRPFLSLYSWFSSTYSCFFTFICHSNYISILLPSMDFLFSDSKLWTEQFQKYVSLLDSDSQKWYSSETNYSSSFFLNLSNIYYLIVIRKDIQELLGHDSVRASVDTIKFLLSKYEGFWKFNDSAIRINHIKDLLNV